MESPIFQEWKIKFKSSANIIVKKIDFQSLQKTLGMNIPMTIFSMRYYFKQDHYINLK